MMVVAVMVMMVVMAVGMLMTFGRATFILADIFARFNFNGNVTDAVL